MTRPTNARPANASSQRTTFTKPRRMPMSNARLLLHDWPDRLNGAHHKAARRYCLGDPNSVMEPQPRMSRSDPNPQTVELAVELTPTAMGGQGDAIAEWQGKRVFVPFALPGERVKAELQPRAGGD